MIIYKNMTHTDCRTPKPQSHQAWRRPRVQYDHCSLQSRSSLNLEGWTCWNAPKRRTWALWKTRRAPASQVSEHQRNCCSSSALLACSVPNSNRSIQCANGQGPWKKYVFIVRSRIVVIQICKLSNQYVDDVSRVFFGSLPRAGLDFFASEFLIALKISTV